MMEISVAYPKCGLKANLQKEIKQLAKDAGVYLKDVGRAELRHHSWGIGLSIYGKDGKFITNMAI